MELRLVRQVLLGQAPSSPQLAEVGAEGTTEIFHDGVIVVGVDLL